MQFFFVLKKNIIISILPYSYTSNKIIGFSTIVEEMFDMQFY